MIVGIVIQVLLIASALYKCKIKDTNFMSVEYTNTLRWICSAIIMLSHINLPEKYHILGCLHFVGVAIFFLLSGYGLTRSLVEGTKEKFIKKHPYRIKDLLLHFTFVVIIKKVFNIDISSGGLYFILVMIVIYIIYGLLVVTIKDTKIFCLLNLIIFTVVYPICSFMILGNANAVAWWSSSAFGFAIGVVMALYFDICVIKIDKLKKITIPISGLIIAVAGIEYITSRGISSIGVKEFFLRQVLSLCSIMLLFSLSISIKIGNEFTSYMGKISLYIFVFHGFCIGIVDNIFNIVNPGIYMLIIIVFDITLAILYDKIVCYIKNKEILRKL